MVSDRRSRRGDEGDRPRHASADGDKLTGGMKKLLILVAVAGALAGCSPSKSGRSSDQAAHADRIPIGQLPDIDTDAVLAHTKVLSSDEFQGRAPGTKGEELTVKYLVDEFKQIGLKPGNTDGTFIQKVPLVGITPAPANLVFTKGAQRQTLTWKS